VAGRYSIDHIAAIAIAIPMSKMIQKHTSGATPIVPRVAATNRSVAPSTMFVPLGQSITSVCRAQIAKTMTAMAEAASARLFIAPAGFANIAL
jgi:hypothetical protein